MTLRRSTWALMMVLALSTLTGCGSVSYLAQSVSGHMQLLNRARPVDEWLADPNTPAALRERLALSQRIRDFAVSELGLPNNASYRRFADLPRPAAVWNVVAAPELSLKLRSWCFPVVGCVSYRGYFDRSKADAAAAELSDESLEVSVYPVPAYSTLGKLPGAYFSDPLLSTFIQYPEGDLARLIFHELAHQVAYASGDTPFNESFATAVERIGGQRWLSLASVEARDEYERLTKRRKAFRALTQQTRQELDTLYRSTLSDAQKRVAKATIMAKMRQGHEALKADAWEGFSGYDRWFIQANNASLGVLAAYDDLAPQFEQLFVRQGSNFERFYAEVQRLAALPRDERHAALKALN